MQNKITLNLNCLMFFKSQAQHILVLILERFVYEYFKCPACNNDYYLEYRFSSSAFGQL